MKKDRIIYFSFAVITVVLGLLSRCDGLSLPEFVSAYAGDTLWAMLVFWIVCIILPAWKIWKRAAVALIFSYAIEFSQLYHAPWIDALRNTKIGGLILGYGFKTSDLACYTAGILIGAVIVKVVMREKDTNT